MAECANEVTGRERMRWIEWNLDLVHGTMVNTNGDLPKGETHFAK
ncbi:hypothetical protein TIFTF001_038345 [Ficus carica]|uniref:Uncharacterized protein n=1 Tax=Ficus carica TaxID=3494 RepID=A0AA88JDM3_FICCA|nr:hypothetical protein TIFTF001_038345 [Ficus carica]